MEAGSSGAGSMRSTWFGIGSAIGLTAAVFVIAAIVDSVRDDEFRRVTFDEVYSGWFSAKYASVYWLGDGESYGILDAATGDISRYDVETEESDKIVDGESARAEFGHYNRYFVSPDAAFTLVASDEQKQWRHSYSAQHALVQGSKQAYLSAGTRQQVVAFSPNSAKVAYVSEGDVFVVDSDDVLERGNTQHGAAVRVTNDAKPGVMNGVHNWVFEEEIFGESSAMWWSPDSQVLAFLHSDESHVPFFDMTEFEAPYVSTVQVPYPKAGERNPDWRLRLHLTCGNTVDVTLPCDDTGAINLRSGEERDTTCSYPTQVTFLEDGRLFVRTLDRKQRNERNFLLTLDVDTDLCVATIGGDDAALFKRNNARWIETSRAFFVDGLVLDVDDVSADEVASEEAAQYAQLVSWDMNGNRRVVTSATFNVGNIVAVQRTDDIVTVHMLSQPMSRTKLLHSVQFDVSSGEFAQLLPFNDDVTDEWQSVNFAPRGRFFLRQSRGAQNGVVLPYTDIVETVTKSTKQVLRDNAELKSALKERKLEMPTRQFIEVPLEDGVSLHGSLLLPPFYEKFANKQGGWPVFVHIYGGPNSQRCHTQLTLGRDAWLASRGVVVACVDGRGTGGRTVDFLKQTVLRLGEMEAEDLVTFGKWLRDNLRVRKLALFGHSFGGFMASRVTAIDVDDVYDATIAGAPVTDWRLYDSVYTERYMQLPAQGENKDGYDATSVMTPNMIEGFRGKNYLLIHGTADDNVHFQHAALLAEKLVAANVQFNSFFYTNEDHAIPSRRHMDALLADFLAEHIDADTDAAARADKDGNARIGY
ncbi:MAG: hypothetical protein MHM6MM_000389 [Cercozoa sp. M6MM]